MNTEAAVLPPPLVRSDGRPAQCACTSGLTEYEAAVRFMEARAASIAAGEAEELVWLVEHPALYSAGVSAKAGDLLEPDRFPVFASGRGGQYTYHGPGQRVVYLMLDLRERGRDVSAFVAGLEAWIIDALSRLGVEGAVRPGKVGVWVAQAAPDRPTTSAKIAAIGVKLRRWVSFHGVSLNVDPDLSHFEGIVACGLPGEPVTSLAQLGLKVGMADADRALRLAFEATFGPLEEAPTVTP